MKKRSFLSLSIFCVVVASGRLCPAAALPKAEGYTGIWYMNQPSHDEYKYKYSGGFATYPQQHVPIAIYRPEVNKTFFCYGGTTARKTGDKQELLHMVSYYDHKTGEVPRPTILLNKKTSDAHDNPTISIDDSGYIYIFSPSHGTARPSYIHRSKKPYSIDEFELLLKTNFSYPEPWYVPGEGFLFLHTRYAQGRNIFSMSSADAKTWSKPQELVRIDMGDYQISWRNGTRVATAFDFHPTPLGLNGRANIYYVETRDLGKTWQTVKGQTVQLPLTSTNNPALVYDSRAEGLLVYLKDINFEANGNPVILFITSKGYASGPKNNPRTWHSARWTGKAWDYKTMTTSDNNYDHGSLYIEPDGSWQVIAPTEPGPQPYNPGGEMARWLSKDQGSNWTKTTVLTHDSKLNHTFARRPVDAQPDFYALWADGNAREPSDCSLYFTNQKGNKFWRLPKKIEGDLAKPELVE